jgi:hypothetical protein
VVEEVDRHSRILSRQEELTGNWSYVCSWGLYRCIWEASVAMALYKRVRSHGACPLEFLILESNVTLRPLDPQTLFWSFDVVGHVRQIRFWANWFRSIPSRVRGADRLRPGSRSCMLLQTISSLIFLASFFYESFIVTFVTKEQ